MRFIFLVLAVAVSSCPVIAQEANVLNPDSYEVYSAVINQHYGSLLKRKAPLLIYGYTVPTFQSHSGVEESCRSRIGQDAVLKQLLDSLVVEKRRFRIDSNLKLEGNFKIGYGKLRVQEGEYPGVVYLSTVAFSENKQVAMVWMSNSCGSLCGGGYLWVLNREKNGWHASYEQLNCGFIR